VKIKTFGNFVFYHQSMIQQTKLMHSRPVQNLIRNIKNLRIERKINLSYNSIMHNKCKNNEQEHMKHSEQKIKDFSSRHESTRNMFMPPQFRQANPKFSRIT